MDRNNAMGGAAERREDSARWPGVFANSELESPLEGEAVVGLMINPTSRRNRKHLEQVLKVATNYPRTHHCITESEDEVSDGLWELADKSANVLAISGGDGTVSRVLTHLLDEKPFDTMPLIAILPGGTANMTAGDVGFRGSVYGALCRLCKWAESGSGQARFVRRPVLRVRPGKGLAATYGMFFGAGAIVQGIEYTNENIHSRGLKNELSLGLGLVRSMWGIARQDPRFIQPASITVSIDGNPAMPPESVVMLLVSSLERLFLNMHPYWGADNGKSLHMTTVRSPAHRLIRNLPSLLRGKPNRSMSSSGSYISQNVDKISLDFEGPFTLDGEIFHADRGLGPVEVSNGGELTFIRVQDE